MVAAGQLDLQAPLLHETKRGTVLMARELGPECWQAIGMSWTCYQPITRRSRNSDPHVELRGTTDVPCRVCPACELRARGFEEAGVADPAA